MARAATVVAGELVSLVAQPDAVPYGRYKSLPVETRSEERNEDSARFRGLFHYFIDRNLRNLRK